jgi:hypothetical protein
MAGLMGNLKVVLWDNQSAGPLVGLMADMSVALMAVKSAVKMAD